MRAFHSNWTAPFFCTHPNMPYKIEPLELLTTMLSALQCQKCGISISMLTDSHGASYYRSLGLNSLWNDGIHIVLDAIPHMINPSIYWAAGKLFALQQMTTPCIMLDTDFILWKDLTPYLNDTKLAAIHPESLAPHVYPNISHFKTVPHTDLSHWDWNVAPCNTALAYFGESSFKDYYTQEAIDFMCKTPDADNALTYMVFAEQRMLSMCATECKIPLQFFSDLPTLFYSEQAFFTHIWGYKQYLRNHPESYTQFCLRCASRIQSDFPDFSEIAASIPMLSSYFIKK